MSMTPQQLVTLTVYYYFYLSSWTGTNFFHYLLISVSRAEILGNSEVFIKSGNDINLTCVAYDAPGPPSFIYWYKGPSVINYSQRGGISVLTERQTKTSKLVISRAMSSDSGNYTCLPSNSGMYLCCFMLCIVVEIIDCIQCTWACWNKLKWWKKGKSRARMFFFLHRLNEVQKAFMKC